MALKKELIIVIEADGTVKIKTEGFKGSECEEELKTVEKALGTVKERTRTSDYYKQTNDNKSSNTNKAK